MSRKIITGDDTRFGVQINKTVNKVTQAMDCSGVASIKIGLVSEDHKTSYLSSPITLESTWSEADWEHGLVEVRIPGTATSSITYQGNALYEIQIVVQEDVEVLTGFLPVTIIRGQVI